VATDTCCIGLTGNIATGKSTVAHMLQQLGACLIDADHVAHELMVPGTAVYHGIVQRFGADILAPGGEINRRALGAIVFADPEALLALDAIVHPAVHDRVRTMVRSSSCPVVVIEAIKLFEAGLDADCDTVWVVTLSPELQLRRLMDRSGLSREQALQRIEAQGDPALLVARADFVIDNSGSLACTRAQVQRGWNMLPACRRD
jgi:dephospho-CoA kinase